MVCVCVCVKLLAGARVSDIDNHQRGAIHMAIEGDFSTILSVLLEHGADPDIMDESGSSGTCCVVCMCVCVCVHVCAANKFIVYLVRDI